LELNLLQLQEEVYLVLLLSNQQQQVYLEHLRPL
jgi:hypothetical protein